MKKIMIGIILAGIILMTMVVAVSFNNKADALNYFNTYKAQRENDLANTESTIHFTTDKVCEINYAIEEISCYACIDYTFREETYKDCVSLSEDSTADQDDEIIRLHVISKIGKMQPVEKIEYTGREVEGKKINIG